MSSSSLNSLFTTLRNVVLAGNNIESVKARIGRLMDGFRAGALEIQSDDVANLIGAGNRNSGDGEDESCDSEEERDDFVLESRHRVDFIDVFGESDRCREDERCESEVAFALRRIVNCRFR